MSSDGCFQGVLKSSALAVGGGALDNTQGPRSLEETCKVIPTWENIYTLQEKKKGKGRWGKGREEGKRRRKL